MIDLGRWLEEDIGLPYESSPDDAYDTGEFNDDDDVNDR